MMGKYDPNTPVSQLGLPPLEARRERQRRSRRAEVQRVRALFEQRLAEAPTLEERVATLEERIALLEERVQ